MNQSFEQGTNVQNYWISGLCPSSSILKTKENNVLEMLCFLAFETLDDGQSPVILSVTYHV
jgi:hypothetical protein